jgi:hypothetical protein
MGNAIRRSPNSAGFLSQRLRRGEKASALAVYIIRVPVHIIILALDCMASPEVAIRRGQSLVVRNDFIDSYPAAADVYDQVAMDCPTGGDCFWRWHYNATIAAAAAPLLSDRVFQSIVADPGVMCPARMCQQQRGDG